jgi:hypothetical protein
MSNKAKVFRKIPYHMCATDKLELLKQHVLRSYNENLSDGDFLFSKDRNFLGMYPIMQNLMFGDHDVHLPLSLTSLHSNAFEWFDGVIRILAESETFRIEVLPTDTGIREYCGELRSDWKKVYLTFSNGALCFLSVTFSDMEGHQAGFGVTDGPGLKCLKKVFRIDRKTKVTTSADVNLMIYTCFEMFLYPEVTMLFAYKDLDEEGDLVQTLWEDHRFGPTGMYEDLWDCIPEDLFDAIHPLEDAVFESHKTEFVKVSDIVLKIEPKNLYSLHGQWEVLKHAHKKLSVVNNVADVLYVSPYDVKLVAITDKVKGRICIETTPRFEKLRRKYRHKEILEIALNFCFLNAPYVVLEIVDWLPLLSYAPHCEKISLIQSVLNSIRKVYAQREETLKVPKTV